MQIETNPPLDEDLQELVEKSPYKPFRYCPRILPAGRDDYVFRSLVSAQHNGATLYVAREGGRTQALLQVEPLSWDSQILGFPVARIRAWMEHGQSSRFRAELLRTVVNELARQGIRYVVARLPAADVAGAHALEQSGFQLVDSLLTFGISPQPPGPSLASNGFRCGAFTPADLTALQAIAATSFWMDRFHADPATREQADAVHRKWIEDSCAGSADFVLVARNQEPVGFTTLKVDNLSKEALGIGIGNIVLVATAAAERRKGVARLLTQAALDWFRGQECSWVEVGTQLANLPAARVYQSAGFALVDSSITFRLLL